MTRARRGKTSMGKVIFVLGGPGVGKGTQCTALTNASLSPSDPNKYIHLSAGDLLRAERSRPNSKYADIINQNIQQGTIVPSQITIDLLKNAMAEKSNNCDYFLIDGFPRNVDQGVAFEEQVEPCSALLFFDCPEEILINRLLKRSETSGRDDDNLDSIKKRLVTYNRETLPVFDHYIEQDKVYKIDCSDTVEVVTNRVKDILKLIRNKE